MLNDEQGTVVRLTAAPVNQTIANSRKRKAKQIKRQTPSKEYIDLLSWSIYLTTIPKEQSDYKQMFKLYSFRWRIEIIFKSWKSHLHFNHIHNVSQIQLYILLLARFIVIVIYIQFLLPCCQKIVAKHSDKQLSLMKMVNYLNNQPQKILSIIEEVKQYKGEIKENITALMRYCSYDKRKRKNFEQHVEEFFLLS